MTSKRSVSGKQKILVIGDVMLDRYLWGDVNRISPEAPVPVIHVKDKSEVLGGAGNVALNLIAMAHPVTLIGVAGSDNAGKRLKGLLVDKKIKNRLLTDSSRTTITKTRIMSRKQQLFRLDEEETVGLNGRLKQKLLERVKKELPGSRAVILSDYNKGTLQTSGLCQKIIRLCKKDKIPVLVDPKGFDWARYKGATCVTPNINELELAAGIVIDTDEHTLIKTALAIKKKISLNWILVTRGPNGMCLIGPDNKPISIRAEAREVFDVTGAGDTVIAALSAGIASGMTMSGAADLANTAAGIVVSKLGTQPVTRAEIDAERRMKLFHQQHAGFIKILSRDAAKIQAQAWRSAGSTVVFTNGCFDLLHPGHISLLNQSRAFGDRLIVGLNTDASVKRLKGADRPILSEKDRAAILSALSSVDVVVLFDEDTPLELIKTLKPDVLVKGADYRPKDVVGKKEIETYGGELKLIPLMKGYSSTKIANKIKVKTGNRR